MAYLRLFYEHYRDQDLQGTPESIIAMAKEKIKRDALSRLNAAALNSFLVEQEFTKLYNIENHEFADVKIKQSLEHSNIVMANFDDAIKQLKTLLKDEGSVTEMVGEGNKALEAIDKILIDGAKAGGLGASAYDELMAKKKAMKKVLNCLKYAKSHQTDLSNKDDLIKAISDIQSNVSGYMWELAHVYAFIGVNYQGLKNAYEVMTNIGGHNNYGLRVHMKIDPTMEDTMRELKYNLSKNNGRQPHADIVFNHYIDDDSNGQISATMSWTGFQNKNVEDISSIGLRDYSLQETDVLKYYEPSFLVNIAGSLAGQAYRASNIPKSLNKSKNHVFQKDVDLLWNKVKASTKVLGVVDAIGQKSGANITNRVHYYVVRSKKDGGKIRVISVSEILGRIIDGYEKQNGDKIGVNDNTDVGSLRTDFWGINAREFSFKRTPQERSDAAYHQILEKILNTKISISLNFSSWFT